MSTPLLGPREKAELETLLHECLLTHFRVVGGAGLLASGLRIVVNAAGVSIEKGVPADCLAEVEIRQLFTAVCYLAGDAGEAVMPEEALGSLATEAASVIAVQINRLA